MIVAYVADGYLGVRVCSRGDSRSCSSMAIVWGGGDSRLCSKQHGYQVSVCGGVIIACVAAWLSGVSMEWDVTRLRSSMATSSSRCCADRFTSYLFIFVS